jgi:hypothetical protein
MFEPHVARDQHGLFSRYQAFEAGWTKGALDRAIAAGRVSVLAPGVYAMAGEELGRRESHLRKARSLVLALGDTWVASRRTAAVLHGLPLLGRAPGEVQLSRDRRGASTSTSRHRRVLTLPAAELSVVDGLACTNLARTVFDLARAESRRSAVVVADAALRTGLSRDALLAVLDRHRGWPGTRRARQVVLMADGRAESPLESLGRVTCVEQDLPVFEPQVEVWVDGVQVARVDGLWREQLVVFEGDGGMKFEGAGVLPALLTRQERLREAGLPVVRASWHDLTRRREAWARGVRRELADNPGRLRYGVELRSTRVTPKPLDRSDHYRWPPLPFAPPRLETTENPRERGAA